MAELLKEVHSIKFAISWSGACHDGIGVFKDGSTADYELAESLSFSFTKMNPDRQGHAYSEIWIPVVKKER